MLALFGRLGDVVKVPERLMGAAGAMMGVGPAYHALLVEAQVDAAVRHGLAPALAGRLVAETMAGTAALLEVRDYDTLAVRREVTSPGGTTARGLAALERGGLRPAFQDAFDAVMGWAALIVFAALTRGDIANYVQALFLVYILLIFVYILLNMVFSLGLRPPYSRFMDAVMNFLRDVCEPYLKIFRRFIPPIGMFDLTPMIAIIVLYIVQDARGQPDQGLMRGTWCGLTPAKTARSLHRPVAFARAALVAAIVIALDQITKNTLGGGHRAGETKKFLPGVTLVHDRNTGVAFTLFAGGGALVLVFTLVAAGRR